MSSPLLPLTLVSILLYILYKHYNSKWLNDVRKLRLPDNAHWLWGHERYTQFEGNYGEAHNTLHTTFGSVVRIKGALFHPDILLISDPASIRHIFTSHPYSFIKSPVFRPLIDRLLGKSLVWADEESIHRRMRNLINPVFSGENVRGVQDDVLDVGEKLRAVLEHYIEVKGSEGAEKEKGKTGTVIDVQEWCAKATLDIIGRVGFGHDFGACESGVYEGGERAKDAEDIAKLWIEQVNLGMQDAGFIAPLVLRLLPFITSLPIPAIQAQGAIKLRVRALAEKIAERGLEDPEVAKGRDLLSTLIRASVSAKQNMSKDELLDHICTFVMVGHETTAGALSFTLHALSQNPSLQSQLRDEILAAGANGKELGYDEYMSGLPILDGVVKEGLRLFPPSAHSERVAVHDDVLPLRYPIRTATGEPISSIRIKKGQFLYISSYTLNTLPSIWGPTATKFDPSRWTTPGSLPKPSETTQGWSQIFAFSEGPRICIGWRLAVFEFKVLLATLIKNFVFRDTRVGIERKFAATLQSRVVGMEERGRYLPVEVEHYIG